MTQQRRCFPLRPAGPQHKKKIHLKFSAVFGQMSLNSSILMRPAATPPIVTSKNTARRSICAQARRKNLFLVLLAHGAHDNAPTGFSGFVCVCASIG